MKTREQIIHYWADWLVDAIATSTQDRKFLRGDPGEDKIVTESLYLNGKAAIERAMKRIDELNNAPQA